MTRAPRPKSDFLRRLAYYLIGISIGLVLLGMFQRARTAEQARVRGTPASVPAPSPPR